MRGTIEELGPCPCCAQQKFRKRFRKKGRDFWRCLGCGLERLHPLPGEDELEDYYDASYVDGIYWLYAEAEKIKRLTARRRIREIKSLCRPGRWLDVGCSTGVFVKEATDQGIDACGIDVAGKAIERGREQGLNLSRATIDDFESDRPFDTLTAFDVIEHVTDPNAFIDRARQLLCPEGTLVVSTPNVGHWARRLMGKRWFFYVPEEHLYYFNPATMRMLLERHGFELLSLRSTAQVQTYEYSLTQFREYNPLVYSVGSALSNVIPQSWRQATIPLHVGQLLAVARKTVA